MLEEGQQRYEKQSIFMSSWQAFGCILLDFCVYIHKECMYTSSVHELRIHVYMCCTHIHRVCFGLAQKSLTQMPFFRLLRRNYVDGVYRGGQTDATELLDVVKVESRAKQQVYARLDKLYGRVSSLSCLYIYMSHNCTCCIYAPYFYSRAMCVWVWDRVYKYIYIYIYIYWTYINIQTDIHTNVGWCGRRHVCMYVNIYIYIYIYIYMYVNMYASVSQAMEFVNNLDVTTVLHICLHARIYMYVYIYILTCMDSHRHGRVSGKA